MNLQEFLAPPSQFRGVVLWMLNDRLEPDRIVEQLDEFAAAGWGAVIARTFNGLRTPYLGDSWMELIGCIVDRCEQLGMKLWLQAGYMPSAMPGLDRARALRGLVLRPAGEPAREGETILHAGPEHVCLETVSGTVVDLLDGACVEEYLDKAYRDPWYSRFSRHFGKTIEAIWVDEPHFRAPLLPWSRRFPEVFQRQWGYDLLEHLPALFLAVGDFQKIRHHYWRTALEMFLEGYFKPVGRWCQAHGVKFAGHLMGEDTLNNQIGWTGAAMPCYESMQLPGIDHLTGDLGWPTGKPFILTPKQLSSVSSQLGKPAALAEMYGVSSEGITFADRKRIANWLMVQGINYRCYHAAFYSMRGRRKRIYPPHLSSQQPWWEDNRRIADPFARLSWALRQGQSEARLLVLHPIESTYCLYDPRSMQRPHDHAFEPDDVAGMDGRLVRLCRNLLDTQHDFEFGDESLLARHGSVDGASLRIGRQSYDVVLLPELITLRRGTLDLLERFVRAGGVIFRVGALPHRMEGVASSEVTTRLAAISRLIRDDPGALEQALESVAPSFARLIVQEGMASDVWMQVRRVEGGRMMFLTNTSAQRAVVGALRVRGEGALEEWDLDSGEVSTRWTTPCEQGLETTLALAPLGSVLLLSKDQPSRAAPVPAQRWKTVRRIPLPPEAGVERDRANALVLDRCRWKLGDGEWNAAIVPLQLQQRLQAEGYVGPVALEFEFRMEDAPTKGLQVVIEDPDLYDVSVNGRVVRYNGAPHFIDRSFLPIDIGDHVRPGLNTIALSCQFRAMQKPSFGLADLFENREGTELESIAVIGKFAVRGTVSGNPARDGCVRFAPGFTLIRERGRCGMNATADGYPFYAGRLTWTWRVELDRAEEGERVLLSLGGVSAAIAHVRVNGRDAGSLPWAPYQMEIGSHLVPGENEISLELASGLRNLIGPHHRSCGESQSTWHSSFDNPPDPRGAYPGVDEPNWTDDYLVTDFGMVGPILVEYQQPQFAKERAWHVDMQ